MDIIYFSLQKGQVCKENKMKETATYYFNILSYISA
jgi:hypothetical protein